MARKTQVTQCIKLLTKSAIIAFVAACATKSNYKAPQTTASPVPTEEEPLAPGQEIQACDRDEQAKGFRMPDFNLPVANNELKVMAYNAENLFDTEHDADHSDWTYLPIDDPLKAKHCKENSSDYYQQQCYKLDWNSTVLSTKIERLARVVEAQGETPDLLALEEVENANVVGMLAKRLGYKHLTITTGSDGRGINNALVYKEDRLTYLEHREVVVGGNLNKHTRNILGVYFKSKKNEKMIIATYVNHWPSQGNPASDRVLAAETLKDMITEDRAKYEKNGSELNVIALGDFNTIPKDKPHPFETVIQSLNWSDYLLDVDGMFKTLVIDKNKQAALCDLVQNMPRGSYYYKKEVQMLDYIFVGKNLNDGKGLDVDISSFRVLATSLSATLETEKVTTKAGTIERQILVPERFLDQSMKPGKIGASDHFPVVVKFKLQ